MLRKLQQIQDRELRQQTIQAINNSEARHQAFENWVILLRILKAKQVSKYVFVRDSISNHINDIDRRDFRQACEKIGLSNLHFHDLRHTWASWHVQSGTPLFTLKEMGGWETLEMVKRYAHLNAAHMVDYADSVTFLTQFHELSHLKIVNHL
ncbi:hypothetical protein A1D23_09485 [Chelonobacter oris]|nr:tyrosine-type recombinase/integrase [Chelonobacter oris]MDH3000650.1 hypothetical protein [Chelonobacter oris]